MTRVLTKLLALAWIYLAAAIAAVISAAVSPGQFGVPVAAEIIHFGVGVTIVLVLSLAGLLGVWWQSIGTPVARARPIPTGVLRIVVFGDSLAFRWGTARPARDGLAPRLAARFAAVRPGSILVNAAFPASAIGQIAASQFPHVTGPAQLVLVISGGNDVRRVSTMAYRLRRSLPG